MVNFTFFSVMILVVRHQERLRAFKNPTPAIPEGFPTEDLVLVQWGPGLVHGDGRQI